MRSSIVCSDVLVIRCVEDVICFCGVVGVGAGAGAGVPTLLFDPTADVKLRSLSAAEDVETWDAALCIASGTRKKRRE